jgi:hypothetical protein
MKPKKKKSKIKSTFSKVHWGCGVGGDCSGICSELHKDICCARFQYKWEYNKQYKEGKQLVVLKSAREEQLLAEAMSKK